ncbi:hypothetical protein BCR39DRAFT_538725 [Naematelia encephala]|uniref:Magnesium transporter NIPA-domain-containing protein n=1 Tax=Naematelia encephala TaxID=71784 RepID=A0A1Y2AX93_9TREE|nr:hypothetical protein BCR39DRAFT_538725 [Naematelia encephala]
MDFDPTESFITQSSTSTSLSSADAFTTGVPTDPISLIATLTSTALDVISTAIDDSPFDWTAENNTIYNTTEPIIPVEGGLDAGEGSYILNTLLGLVIVLVASCLNALGLNLTKLDHVRQQSIPKRQRRKEYMRILWLAGMGTYIVSQVFGSPLALRYLRPDWVAPLGSSSLVFNFLFASWLVGTPVTPADIRGTIVIVLGVILILIFSSINHGLQQSLPISRLDTLWSRGSWLAYFVFLILFTASTYYVSHLLAALLKMRGSFSPLPSPSLELPPARPKTSNIVVGFFKKWSAVWKAMDKGVVTRLENMLQRTDDARITWLQGIGWAVAGGSLAGLCLVFTKAIVKILQLPGHPLVHFSAIITLLFVIGTAVLQIVCLNRALVCADTVVVVPLFYAGYTVFGFINSLIFYDEAVQYARWVLVAVFLSIGVLIAGVVLLSLKASAKTAPDPYTVSAQPASSIRLRPQRRKSYADSAPDDGAKNDGLEDEHQEPDEVMWEVGSVSDTSEDGKGNSKEQRGVGGTKGHGGERRGLLDEDDRGEEEGGGPSKSGGDEEKNPFDDSEGRADDDFGEYEAVSPLPKET